MKRFLSDFVDVSSLSLSLVGDGTATCRLPTKFMFVQLLRSSSSNSNELYGNLWNELKKVVRKSWATLSLIRQRFQENIKKKALCVAIEELFAKHDAGLVYMSLDHKQNPWQPPCVNDPISKMFLINRDTIHARRTHQNSLKDTCKKSLKMKTRLDSKDINYNIKILSLSRPLIGVSFSSVSFESFLSSYPWNRMINL